MNEVLLIQPALTFERAYPLGLGAIAAALEDAGVQVTGHHDQVQPLDRLLALARSGRFAWIGISALSLNLPRALELARWVHSGTAAPIVLGGPHVTVRPADGLAEPAVTGVVRGEGEAAAVALSRVLAGDGGRGAEVPGFVTRGVSPVLESVAARGARSGAGSAAGGGGSCLSESVGARENPLPPEPMPLLDDLDAWPDARRDLFPDAELDPHGLGRPAHSAPLITSRGCPYTCATCPAPALSGGEFRRRSPERVVAEVDWLAGAGVTRLLLEDDQILADREHLFTVCDALAGRGRVLPFSCANGLRPELLDRTAAHALARAGCEHVALGLESATPTTLRRLGRCTDLSAVRRAVAGARAEGLRVSGCFMLGLPGEGLAAWRRSLALAVELELEVAHFNVYDPLPGSALAATGEPARVGPVGRALLQAARGTAYVWYHGRPDRALRTLRGSGAGLGAAPAALTKLLRWIGMRTS